MTPSISIARKVCEAAGARQVAPVMLAVAVAELCSRPYPGHPKGCPNLGKKAGCPKVPPLGEVLDLDRPVWVVWNCYPLGAHVEKMRGAHPSWSQRQLECCLYWQGSARKQLSTAIDSARGAFHRETGCDTKAIRCPEAYGVDVTATMLSVGVALEWPPVTKAYQVALIGAAVAPLCDALDAGELPAPRR